MRRWILRLVVAALLCLGAAAAPLWGRDLLQRISWFEVRRVEVSGARLLPPHEVLAASGIKRGRNVWEDPSAWETALSQHPVVLSARVSRRLPHTLRIRIEEERPVALVESGSLRPATAEGVLLPVDPARVALDLPLLRTRGVVAAQGSGEGAEARSLLAETGRLAELDPAFLARVSEVRGTESGELLLLLAHPAAEVVLPAGASSQRLRQLRTVLEEIERDPAAEVRPRLDLRFADQVVVRE
ncbi:MAG: FtsQ-type POTRA domain-containing protein [Gemmatimonadetes bacterium]|nr:FtsQ-type POTRA domain-containing protein [Gemmatimonadota bacterium]